MDRGTGSLVPRPGWERGPAGNKAKEQDNGKLTSRACDLRSFCGLPGAYNNIVSICDGVLGFLLTSGGEDLENLLASSDWDHSCRIGNIIPGQGGGRRGRRREKGRGEEG